MDQFILFWSVSFSTTPVGQIQYKKLAANMRKALPNAHYIGFTGTPISKKDRNTFGTFGTYIDRYDHIQSEKDGKIHIRWLPRAEDRYNGQ